MEWVKLYTTFHDHRKTVELDANAIALWTLCLSWSGAQDTDGFIPRRIALRFLGGELGDEAAARLVRVGLWEAVDAGYRMRNWDERQDGADLVQARRAANRERQQRWRDRRHASRNPLRDASVTGAREEEKREDQTDSPPSPPQGGGAPGDHPVQEASPPQPTAMPDSPDGGMGSEYSDAFAASHAGRAPARSLVSGIAAEASRLAAEGHPRGDLIAAVRRCAELSRGPGLLPVALAEVQAGAPRQRDRPGRSDLMDRWERVHFGARP